jgi:hypothetical protein
MSNEAKQSKLSIGIMTIATNVYIDYWAEMIQSADKYPSKQFEIVFHVFTDNFDRAQKVAQKLKNVQVQVHQTPAYAWPEATLLRYSVFSECADNLNQDYLMHLDADMLFVSSPWEELQETLQNFPICLIQHPGFWRASGASRARFYKTNPGFLLKDLYRIIENGALGAWEKNVKSTAYVPRKLRYRYFCGGIWFGKRSAIQRLIADLAKNVSEDSSNGIMAKWHDESHLNKWSSQNQHEVLGPKFCFDTTYPQLVDLEPIILAIRKKELTR